MFEIQTIPLMIYIKVMNMIPFGKQDFHQCVLIIINPPFSALSKLSQHLSWKNKMDSQEHMSCKQIIYPPVNHYSHGKSPSFLIHTIKLVDFPSQVSQLNWDILSHNPKKVFWKGWLMPMASYFCQLSIATYIHSPPKKKIEFDGRTEVFTGGPL